MTKRQAEKAALRTAMRLYRIWDKPIVGGDLTPLWAGLTANWKSCARLAKLKGKK